MNNTNYLNLIDAIGSNLESPWNCIPYTDEICEDEKYHILSPLLNTFVDFSEKPVIDISIPHESTDMDIINTPQQHELFRQPHTEEDRLAYLDSINNDDHNMQGLLKAILPNGFSPDAIKKTTILAVSNKSVDEWNDIIASLNTNPEEIFESTDWFSEVLKKNVFQN